MARDTTQHTLVVGHSTENVEPVPEGHTITTPFNMTVANDVHTDYVLRKEALVSTSALLVVSLVNRNELLSLLIFQIFVFMV